MTPPALNDFNKLACFFILLYFRSTWNTIQKEQEGTKGAEPAFVDNICLAFIVDMDCRKANLVLINITKI